MSQTFNPQTASTIIDLLQVRAIQTPEQIAYEFLVDGDDESQRLTYADLEQRSRGVASVLRETCEVGDRVLILQPPGLSYITVFFGCLYGGLIAVPAYPPRRNRSVDRIVALLKDAQPKIAVTTQVILALLKSKIIEIPELRTVQWCLSDRLDFSLSPAFSPPSVTGESLAFLQYTSGSTAKPKGVMITHRNILHNIGWMHHYVKPGAKSHGVSWLPPYHDMGLISGIIAPLYAGLPVTLMSPFHFLQRPVRWLKAISTRQASFSGGPSFAYELCVDKIKSDDLPSLDLSGWKVAFNGAEPIQAKVIHQFAQKFAPCGFQVESFIPCYGMAEATLMVTWSHQHPRPQIKKIPKISANLLVSSGQSLGDQSVRIVDPITRVACPDGDEGEIWVSGESVAQGYWNREVLTGEVFQAQLESQGPFLRTGDLGVLRHGSLYVTGRIKDLLIINGVNYHPQDLEYHISQCHPAIHPLGIAAVSIQQPCSGAPEQLLVCVELERQFVRQTDQYEAIVQAIKQSVSNHFQLVLDHAVILRPGRIPKTSSGKIQRYLCREQFLKGMFDPLLSYQLKDQ